jgi:RND superfamily putative drug exporter
MSGALVSAFGRWVVRHRARVIGAWVVALLATSWMAIQARSVLSSGSGNLPRSQSLAVRQALQREFRSALGDGLLVVLEPADLPPDGEAFAGLASRLDARLRAYGERVEGPFTHATIMRDGVAHPQRLWLVSPRQRGPARAIDPVAALRERLADVRAEQARLDPGGLLAVTGGRAVNADIGAVSKADGQRAETYALPLTLLALVLAFRAPLAAAAPLVGAGAAIALAMAGIYVLSHAMVLSDLLENIVTMIGLAVGIDYALLVIERWREERRLAPADEALLRALQGATPSILASGGAILCGMLGLALAPLVELRSMAVGGALVVVLGVAAALTLLPALLASFPRAIQWPGWSEAPPERPPGRVARLQAALATHVTGAPRRTLAGAALVVAALLTPAASFSVGATAMTDLPRHMESARGLAAIERMDIGNAVFDVQVLIRTTDGSPILDARHMPALVAWKQALERDPRVRRVLGPLSWRPQATLVENQLLFWRRDAGVKKLPPILQGFVSDDGQAMLVDVLPATSVSTIEVQAMAAAIAARGIDGPFTFTVGGQPTYLNELSTQMDDLSLPIWAVVSGSTALLLGLTFRSVLVPLKAIALNMVSVVAGYGVITMVCQWGWGASLIGLEHPLLRVPPFVPLLLFCIMFGLSMDYEIFMISRIREGVMAGLDQRRAVLEGLRHAWPLITRAAWIMVIVFGAFVTADIVVVKVLGLGLATAVLVDATLVRMVLGPALMMVAGRYNWWPGLKPQAP